jgi:hypothetical protein
VEQLGLEPWARLISVRLGRMALVLPGMARYRPLHSRGGEARTRIRKAVQNLICYGQFRAHGLRYNKWRRDLMAQRQPRWNWTGVEALVFDGQDSPLRDLLKMLPPRDLVPTIADE